MTVRLATEQEQQADAMKHAECLKFLKRGLAVIYDRCLVLELEIKAGFSPPIDIESYRNDLVTALASRAEKLYDDRTIGACRHEAKIDPTEWGIRKD